MSEEKKEVEVEVLEADYLPPVRKAREVTVLTKDDEAAERVRRLSGLGLSKNAVCIAAGVTIGELNGKYAKEYALGYAGMQEVIAKGLMEQAKGGNPQVLMYLGKSKLGWSESNIVEHVGEIRAVVSSKPLTKEEFQKRYLASDEDEKE